MGWSLLLSLVAVGATPLLARWLVAEAGTSSYPSLDAAPGRAAAVRGRSSASLSQLMNTNCSAK